MLFIINHVLDPVISKEDNEHLTRNLSGEEMNFALKESNSQKAPGPDGLNAGALKAFWHLLREGLLRDFQKFMDSG